MRKEVLDWLNAAEDDLKTAGILLRDKVFYASAFYSQQSAEKALKAIYIHKMKKISVIHNIIGLARELAAPEDITAACKRLNTHYAQSRYPDAANAIPSDAYDEKIADSLLNDSKKVFKWCESQAKD